MEVLMIILNWGIPVVCTGILSLISKKLKEISAKLKDNEDSNKAMKESMIILLRSQIVSKIEKYMELGYLPDYARSCITDLFTQYEALGGNHGVKKLVDNCLELPPILNKFKKERKNERI